MMINDGKIDDAAVVLLSASRIGRERGSDPAP
jgi:hypothetical protein